MANGTITLEALFIELGSMKAAQTANHSEITSKLDNIQSNCDSVSGVIADHSSQLKSLDYDKRRKNLMVFGVPEEQTDLESVLLSLIRIHLKVTDFSLMELDFCRRLGKEPKSDRPRPIIVGLTTQRRKMEILKNSSLLKNTSVFIKQDISPEAREANKRLREERKKLRNQGNNVVIRKGQLICNGNIVPLGSFTPSTSAQERNSNKRAISESPTALQDSQKSAVKKTNFNTSEDSDAHNTTMIQNENQDNFSDTSMDFQSPAESPLRHSTSGSQNIIQSGSQNLMQPSILSFITNQQEKNA